MECNLCSEPFDCTSRIPCELNCGHTVCRSCGETLIKGKIISCHVCLAPSPASFRLNEPLMDLIQYYPKYKVNLIRGKWNVTGCDGGSGKPFLYSMELHLDHTGHYVTGKTSNGMDVKGSFLNNGKLSFNQSLPSARDFNQCKCHVPLDAQNINGTWLQPGTGRHGTFKMSRVEDEESTNAKESESHRGVESRIRTTVSSKERRLATLRTKLETLQINLMEHHQKLSRSTQYTKETISQEIDSFILSLKRRRKSLLASVDSLEKETLIKIESQRRIMANSISLINAVSLEKMHAFAPPNISNLMVHKERLEQLLSKAISTAHKATETKIDNGKIEIDLQEFSNLLGAINSVGQVKIVSEKENNKNNLAPTSSKNKKKRNRSFLHNRLNSAKVHGNDTKNLKTNMMAQLTNVVQEADSSEVKSKGNHRNSVARRTSVLNTTVSVEAPVAPALSRARLLAELEKERNRRMSPSMNQKDSFIETQKSPAMARSRMLAAVKGIGRSGNNHKSSAFQRLRRSLRDGTHHANIVKQNEKLMMHDQIYIVSTTLTHRIRSDKSISSTIFGVLPSLSEIYGSLPFAGDNGELWVQISKESTRKFCKNVSNCGWVLHTSFKGKKYLKNKNDIKAQNLKDVEVIFNNGGKVGMKCDRLRVNEVSQGGQAEKAGVLTGWIILAVDKQPIERMSQLSKILIKARKNNQMTITFAQVLATRLPVGTDVLISGSESVSQKGVIQRAYNPITSRYHVELQSSPNKGEIVGILASHITKDRQKENESAMDIVVTFLPNNIGIGVKKDCVINVKKDSQADKAGVKKGMKIITANDKPVYNESVIKDELNMAIKNGCEVVLRFRPVSSQNLTYPDRVEATSQSKPLNSSKSVSLPVEKKTEIKEIKEKDWSSIEATSPETMLRRLIKDRKKFSGSDLVSWMMMERVAMTRSEAVRKGQDFMEQCYIVADDPTNPFFDDTRSHFQFNEDLDDDITNEKEKNLVPTSISQRLRFTFHPNARIGISLEKSKVYAVSPGTQAYSAGICRGWRVIEVNGEVVPDKGRAIQKAIIKTVSKKKKTAIVFAPPPGEQFWRVTGMATIKVSPRAKSRTLGTMSFNSIITGGRLNEWLKHPKGWSLLHQNGQEMFKLCAIDEIEKQYEIRKSYMLMSNLAQMNMNNENFEDDSDSEESDDDSAPSEFLQYRNPNARLVEMSDAAPQNGRPKAHSQVERQKYIRAKRMGEQMKNLGMT